MKPNAVCTNGLQTKLTSTGPSLRKECVCIGIDFANQKSMFRNPLVMGTAWNSRNVLKDYVF